MLQVTWQRMFKEEVARLTGCFSKATPRPGCKTLFKKAPDWFKEGLSPKEAAHRAVRYTR